MVPNNMPKGSRQETRSNMQRAGIPLAPRSGQTSAGSPQAASPGPVSAPGGDPVARVLSENTPADFPFLSDRQGGADSAPTPPPSDPQSTVSALAGSAQSTFGTAVLRRLTNRRS